MLHLCEIWLHDWSGGEVDLLLVVIIIIIIIEREGQKANVNAWKTKESMATSRGGEALQTRLACYFLEAKIMMTFFEELLVILILGNNSV